MVSCTLSGFICGGWAKQRAVPIRSTARWDAACGVRRHSQHFSWSLGSNVAVEQARALAVAGAFLRRMIFAGDLLLVLRVHRFGAAARSFIRQAVPIRELIQVGILAGQMVGDCALRPRHFRRILASEHSDVLAGIEIPVVAARPAARSNTRDLQLRSPRSNNRRDGSNAR